MTRFLASAPQIQRNCGLQQTWASAFDQVTFLLKQHLSVCRSLLPNAWPSSLAKLDHFSALLRYARRRMAAAEKSSFLGSLSPWSGVSRNASPNPSKGSSEVPKDDPRLSSANDHSTSLRPSPSLRRYPRDCPPLRTRWFYAVDAPKRKPFTSDSENLTAAKRLVPFSTNDSQAIENEFQTLDRGDSPDRPST